MTVLVDSSVWIDHLRRGNQSLEKRLDVGGVACHSLIIGELACGNLRNRREVLDLLQVLPRADEVTLDEALQFVDGNRLYGRGLGWIDIQLLASARVAGLALWTLDRRLAAAARDLGVGDGAELPPGLNSEMWRREQHTRRVRSSTMHEDLGKMGVG